MPTPTARRERFRAAYGRNSWWVIAVGGSVLMVLVLARALSSGSIGLLPLGIIAALLAVALTGNVLIIVGVGLSRSRYDARMLSTGLRLLGTALVVATVVSFNLSGNPSLLAGYLSALGAQCWLQARIEKVAAAESRALLHYVNGRIDSGTVDTAGE